MKLPKLFLATALLLGLSSVAFATTIDNVGGTFTNPSGGLQLSGAQLTLVTGLGGFDFAGTHAGTAFDFSIGAPTSGTIALGSALWSSAPGSTLTFSDSVSGLTFVGSFSCSATANCNYNNLGGFGFVFSGTFTGVLNGNPVSGATAQLHFVPTPTNPTGNSGTSQIAATVPEVGTISMVGIGLLGIAGFAKRKFSALIS